VLLLGADDFPAFLSKEGLARFCTVKYAPPSSKTLAEVRGYLTNYALNKGADEFVRSDDVHASEGSKRSLASLMTELARKGHDVDALWTRLERLVDRTIGAMRHAVRDAAVANRAHPEMCFQGAFCTLVPIRPRSRGERRFLRTFPGVSLRPPVAFNPRPRRLSTPTDAFQLHPDVRSYEMTLSSPRVRRHAG